MKRRNRVANISSGVMVSGNPFSDDGPCAIAWLARGEERISQPIIFPIWKETDLINDERMTGREKGRNLSLRRLSNGLVSS